MIASARTFDVFYTIDVDNVLVRTASTRPESAAVSVHHRIISVSVLYGKTLLYLIVNGVEVWALRKPQISLRSSLTVSRYGMVSK